MSAPLQPASVHQPSWAGKAWVDTTYGDGNREVIHDVLLTSVTGHDAWLMSYQFVDPSGHVTVHDELIHLTGEGPLTPADAKRLAAALVRGASVLEADQAARSAQPGGDTRPTPPGARP